MSIVAPAARADVPVFLELPSLATPEPFTLPDDSLPLPPDEFFSVFPNLVLPVSEYTTLDHDGDGQSDVIAPSIAFDPLAPALGHVAVFSGWTGQQMYEIASGEPNDLFGIVAIGVPDMTGDGKAEILVSAPASSAGGEAAGRVYLYNGADGATLTTFTAVAANGALGMAIAPIGDIDGDGRAEIAAAAPLDGAGRVFVFLSAALIAPDGSFLPERSTADADLVYAGEAPGDLFGSSIANAGDVTGDGFDELLIGAPSFDGAGPDTANFGRASLFSGSNGTLLGTVTGASTGELLGFSVAPAGDLDGDTRADILIGAPSAPALIDAGRTSIFYAASMTAGAVPFTLSAADADISLAASVWNPDTNTDGLFGFFTAMGNDVNHDGNRDLIVHAGFRDETGAIAGTRGYMFSGADGDFLYTFPADGGGGTTPEFEGDDGGPDQLEIVLTNQGMENATFEDGDLNTDTSVNVTDLIIILQNPDGLDASETATADAQAPQPGGNEGACLGVVSEDPETGQSLCDGEPVAGGGGPIFPSDPDGGSPWVPCQNINVPDDPSNPDECIVWAWCTAATDQANNWNALNATKKNNIAAHDNTIRNALIAWQGSPNPAVVTPSSPRGIAEKNRVQSIKASTNAGGLKIFVGTVGGSFGAVALIAKFTNPPAGVTLTLLEIAGGVGFFGGAGLTASGISQVQNAATNANIVFNANPSRIGFNTTHEVANQLLLSLCAVLEHQSDMIINQIQQTANERLTQCLEGLTP